MVEKHLFIDPSGKISWILLDREPDFGPVYQGSSALDLMQIRDWICCSWLEQVRTVLPDIVLVIDESGKIKDPPQPHNELASRLYYAYHIGADDICGPAFVMALRPSGPYGEHDWQPLNDKDLACLSLYLGVQLSDK